MHENKVVDVTSIPNVKIPRCHLTQPPNTKPNQNHELHAPFSTFNYDRMLLEQFGMLPVSWTTRETGRPKWRPKFSCVRCRTSLHNTLKHFADCTTFHGFLEVYYSKSIFWKLVWLSALAAAIGFSTMQLYSSTKRFLDNPTTTSIQPLSSAVEYPPLVVCYFHWLAWVDFQRANTLGFDKTSTLYGLSYMSKIFSETVFDVDESRRKFVGAMDKNGFQTLTEFYDAISPESPPGVKIQYVDDGVEWEKFLHPAYSHFCYRLSNDMLKLTLETFKQNAPNTRNTIEFMYNRSFFHLDTNFVSFDEYKIYIEGFLASYGSDETEDIVNLNSNESQWEISPEFNYDNVRINKFMIAEDFFEIKVRLSGSLYKWMNTKRRECTDSKSTYYDNCDKYCHWLEIRDKHPEKCIEASAAELIGEKNRTKICTFDIAFLSESDEISGEPDTFSRVIFNLHGANESLKACYRLHCLIPCDHWKFTSTISAVEFPSVLRDLKRPSLLSVQYPYPDDIVMFMEVPSLTLESVMAEIGGIIGLWLGASILSLLQIVYLCCCSGCDAKIGSFNTG